MCEGAVIKELKTKVKICENGKLKFKNKDEVEPGYPMGGRDCKWKGEIICDGRKVEVSIAIFLFLQNMKFKKLLEIWKF